MSDTPPKLTALVVDDCDELRVLVRRSLEALDYEVTCADTGKAAVTLLKGRYFDLVVTDLIMPEADGIEVIAEMKRRYPSARIVAMTGGGEYLSSDLSVKLMAHLGAHTVLLKPFSPPQLCAAVLATAAHTSSP